MGLLDGLAGFWKKPGPKPAAGRREMRLGELESFLKTERAGKLAPFAEKSRDACGKILDELADAARAAESLRDAEPTGKWSRIGEQMRENFITRIVPTLGIARHGEGFEAAAEFHSKAFAAISACTKILSDNRYLLHFFPKSMGGFAKRMNAASALVEELGKIVQGGRQAAAGFDAAVGALREREKTLSEKAVAEKEMGELEAFKTGLKKRIAEETAAALPGGRGLGGAVAGGGAYGAVEKIAGIEKRVGALKAELAVMLNPLDRLFRKLEKISLEKRVAEKAAFYAAGPADAVVEGGEEGLEELKRLAEEVGKELAAGRLETDGEKRKKAVAALERIDFGKVSAAVNELGSLEKEKAAAAAVLEREKAAERERRDLEEELAAVEMKKVALEEKIRGAAKKLAESVAGIEKSASAAAGVEIKIAAE
ncbi:MAG: hypothetical protein NTY90_01580 [Candidatus Micrarchaeota archaeon]|nr:hypothetical protein [Candidatus Micrarchaeota archaeon]